MEALTQVIASVPSGALPLVVVILGLFWIYRKTESINKDREDTKQQRDKDSQDIHDRLLTHEFKISNLQGVCDLHRDKLDSIDKQLSIVNQELVKLNLSVEHLSAALKEQNDIMRDSLKDRK